MPDVSDGRVSVGVFWYPEQCAQDSGSRHDGACARCGVEEVLLQEAPNGSSFCEACWAEYLQGAGVVCRQDGDAEAENDMLAAALQMSLVEQ